MFPPFHRLAVTAGSLLSSMLGAGPLRDLKSCCYSSDAVPRSLSWAPLAVTLRIHTVIWHSHNFYHRG